MKKDNLIVSVLAVTFLMQGCKSAEQRRIECEDYAKEYVAEWMNISITGETKTFLNNYFELIDEYGKKLPYKTFKHIKGMNSDTDGFKQQILKDWKWIKEADAPYRYLDINLYELENSRIWYANDDDEKLSEGEIMAKRLCQKDSLIKYFTSDDYIWEDVDPEKYKEDLSYHLNYVFKEWFSYVNNLKYLLFVHTEYEYPLLVIDDESFEAGIKCSRLQIFQIADKKCLLDKRIFATTGDDVFTVYNKPIDELSIRTEYEVELQGHKIGIPFIKDPRIRD